MSDVIIACILLSVPIVEGIALAQGIIEGYRISSKSSKKFSKKL